MNRLKKLRVKSDITLRELSKYVNIRNATLSLVENNKQPMREIHVLKLTSFFDVTSDYLLGYSNNGIGIYFDDEHAYVSASEFEKLKERYEVKETLINHIPSNFVVRTATQETQSYRGEHSIFRSVNVSIDSVALSEFAKEKLLIEINKLDGKDLEKVLKFINEYIK